MNFEGLEFEEAESLPDDSDILTSEDLADSEQARLEYSRGECVDLDDFIATLAE